jgi:hypothetical protein
MQDGVEKNLAIDGCPGRTISLLTRRAIIDQKRVSGWETVTCAIAKVEGSGNVMKGTRSNVIVESWGELTKQTRGARAFVQTVT